MARVPLPDPKTPHDRYLHDIATTQRAILDHLTGGTSDEGGEGTVALREPAVDLDSMTRDELDGHARKVGVAEPEKLPNKDAVKAAIAEAG